MCMYDMEIWRECMIGVFRILKYICLGRFFYSCGLCFDGWTFFWSDAAETR